MTLSRRDVVKLGVGASASLLVGLRPKIGYAQNTTDLITRTIPSTGAAPLPDDAMRKRMEQLYDSLS